MLKNYKAVNGQSIFDVCLNTYGTLDRLIKQLVDSGAGQGVNNIPASGQVYVYDDELVEDQAVSQAYLLTGVRYATINGTNGQTYYILNQNNPPVVPPGVPPTVVPPVNPDDMITQVSGAQFVSGADGTNVMTLMDKDGNSMIGNDLIQIEKEIRPVINANWVWNKTTGILTLINGEAVDAGQTLFYLYSKII
jgi:hypothetical protein